MIIQLKKKACFVEIELGQVKFLDSIIGRARVGFLTFIISQTYKIFVWVRLARPIKFLYYWLGLGKFLKYIKISYILYIILIYYKFLIYYILNVS